MAKSGIIDQKTSDKLLALAESGTLTPQEILGGLKAASIVTFPGEPWEGVAQQSFELDALKAREQVLEGGNLYRIGKLGKSDTYDAQFWAIENPESQGYAAKYGIPKDNVEQADFLEVASLKDNSNFITRPAPPDPDGINPSGAIEVVVNKSDVNMSTFHAGHKTKYTGN